MSLIAVPVIHCPQAYGVIISYKDNIKLSFSGDTRPCPLFAEKAINSDIMVHEGTFGNDL